MRLVSTGEVLPAVETGGVDVSEKRSVSSVKHWAGVLEGKARHGTTTPEAVKAELRRSAANDFKEGIRLSVPLYVVREASAVLVAAYYAALEQHLHAQRVDGEIDLSQVEKEIELYSGLLMKQLEAVIPEFRPPRRNANGGLRFLLDEFIDPARLNKMMSQSSLFGERDGGRFVGMELVGQELEDAVKIDNRKKPGFSPSNILMVLNSGVDLAIIAEQTRRHLANIRTTGVIELKRSDAPLVSRRGRIRPVMSVKGGHARMPT